MSRIAILGSGAWGTAIALSLNRRGGHELTLWAHSHEFAKEIIDAGENTLFLPGFPIPAGVRVTGEEAAVGKAEIVVSVIPSEFLRAALTRLRPHLHTGQIIVSATKGVEDQSLLRMSRGDCRVPDGNRSRSQVADRSLQRTQLCAGGGAGTAHSYHRRF